MKKKLKENQEWVMTLSDEAVRAAIFDNVSSQKKTHRLFEFSDSLSDCIEELFDWSKTPQTGVFWASMCLKIKRNERRRKN